MRGATYLSASGTSTHPIWALPSTNYGPIRHLPRPTWPLAGPPLPTGCRPIGAGTDFPCCVSVLSARAVATTPVGPSGAHLAHFPGDDGLPRYVRFAALQKRTFPRMFQTIRHLLIRPRCFRSERDESDRVGFDPT